MAPRLLGGFVHPRRQPPVLELLAELQEELVTDIAASPLLRKPRASACGECVDDIHAVHVRALTGEQGCHVAAAGAHFEDAVFRGYRKRLQYARFELGRKHHLAVADGDFQIGESEGLIRRRHEIGRASCRERVSSPV